MFVTSSDYEKVVTSIAEEEGELLVAVAFWGRGAESIVHPRASGRVKLICNLGSGATNPAAIDFLRNREGILLKQNDRLHAKVVVGSTTAVVGSANFSCNGLNFEGNELEGWEEAGLLTRDSAQLSTIRDWFRAMWKHSRAIKDRDIEEAKLKWEQRRATRIKNHSSPPLGFALGNFSRSDVLDRRIFVAMYGSWLSPAAKAAYRKYKKELTGQPISKTAKLPPMYEGWPKLPKEAQIIDLYYGSRGALRCYGVFTRTHDVKFKYSDGSKGHLALCRKDNKVMDYPFRSKEALQFAKDLKPHIEEIWNSKLAVGDEDGKYIHLADIVDICG
jgi:hypothetical protein